MIIRELENYAFNYTVVNNEVADHPGLSLEAKGLFLDLISKPLDWKINQQYIQKKYNIGRDKCRRLFKELMDAGYAHRVDRRVGGRFSSETWVVCNMTLSDEQITEITGLKIDSKRSKEMPTGDGISVAGTQPLQTTHIQTNKTLKEKSTKKENFCTPEENLDGSNIDQVLLEGQYFKVLKNRKVFLPEFASKKKFSKDKLETLIVPDFINLHQLAEFIEYREKGTKSIVTSNQCSELFKKLAEIERGGYSHVEAIEDAICGGWKSVYLPDDYKNNRFIGHRGASARPIELDNEACDFSFL